MKRLPLIGAALAFATATFLVPAAVSIGAQGAGRDDPDAFGRPMNGIDSALLAKFNYGLGLFRHERQPVSQAGGQSSGPGPLYNARSCSGCHVGDGRGAVVGEETGETRSMVFGLQGPDGPDPVYGVQLQDRAIDGVTPEGQPRVRWSVVKRQLPDGSTVELRRPAFEISALGYGPLATGTLIDARIAPQLVGLGWLAALDDATIVGLADPDDRDGNGISGAVHFVDLGAGPVVGRFGWKATMPDLASQAAQAARLDMGLSSAGSAVRDGECTSGQTDCLAKANADRAELSSNDVTLIAHYVAFLGVPERGAEDAATQRGAALFQDIGCGACHLASLHTGANAAAPFADQDIAAYTDLLLHDMGPDLAGGYAVGTARAEEWAHTATVGHRPDSSGKRRGAPLARWAGPQFHRGHSLARRRSAIGQ